MPLSLLCEQPVVGVEIDVFVPSTRSAQIDVFVPSTRSSPAGESLSVAPDIGADAFSAGEPSEGGGRVTQQVKVRTIATRFATKLALVPSFSRVISRR